MNRDAEKLVSVDVGADYSRYPAGRTPDDGKYNGETFRERFLKGPLQAGSTITILLDGAISYGSSFLEEAFGGLVRVYGYSKDMLSKRIKLQSEDPFLIDEIWAYIDGAAAEIGGEP